MHFPASTHFSKTPVRKAVRDVYGAISYVPVTVGLPFPALYHGLRLSPCKAIIRLAVPVAPAHLGYALLKVCGAVTPLQREPAPFRDRLKIHCCTA